MTGILNRPFHVPLLALLLRRAVLVEVVELAAGEHFGVAPLAVCFLDGPLDKSRAVVRLLWQRRDRYQLIRTQSSGKHAAAPPEVALGLVRAARVQRRTELVAAHVRLVRHQKLLDLDRRELEQLIKYIGGASCARRAIGRSFERAYESLESLSRGLEERRGSANSGCKHQRTRLIAQL